MEVKYKVLYQKMMDDLKDSGMWIEWACSLKSSNREVADYLIKSANIRLKENYKDSKKWFEYIADKDSKDVGRCMKETFVEEFDEWCDSLMRKIDKYELIEEKTKEEE